MKSPSSGSEVLILEKWTPSSLMSLILAVPAAMAQVLENPTLFLASDQNQYFRGKCRTAKELKKVQRSITNTRKTRSSKQSALESTPVNLDKALINCSVQEELFLDS